MWRYKKINFLFLFSAFAVNVLYAQWSVSPFEHKVFIENKGQFDGRNLSADPIYFGVNNLGAQLYFSSNGLTIRYDKPVITENNFEKEYFEEALEEWEEEEKEQQHTQTETVIIKYEWLNANPDVKLIVGDTTPGIYNYGENKNWTNCKAHKKLIYQNLYDGIDVEYVFHPKKGIKYSLIVHPGADISQVKIECVSKEKPELKNGEFHLSTQVGLITEHAPLTFYQDDKTTIESRFSLQNNILSFYVKDYNHSKTIVIDPWVIIPILPSNNKAYEIQKDLTGNVYVYGGSGNPSFTLNKYDPLGVLQWTLALPLSGIDWSGDLLVDNSGFSYVTDGASGPGNNIAKINNTTGIPVWSTYTAPGEFFRLTHNCDKSKFYTAGGPSSARMTEINPSTGAATGSLSLGANEEIKSIARSPNGNYYFLMNTSFTNTNNNLYAADGSFTVLWIKSNGHNYSYDTPKYLPDNGGGNYIAVNEKFIYTYDGTLLLKRNICNGNLLDSVNVPSGIFEMNGGLMVDSCGYVYAGSQNGIYKYDANLVFISSVSTAKAVYDISIGINSGELLACGDSFAASINMAVCQPVPFPATCPVVLTTSLSISPPACGSSCIGTATISASGTPPYNYLWSSGGQTTASITGLCPGGYSVTVTDKFNYCNASITGTLTSNAVPTATVTQTNVLCNGGNTGGATVNASGATSPYTYWWSNQQTSGTVTNLFPGNYTVRITSANGCTSLSTFTITQPPVISATLSSTNTICTNGNGSVTVAASGGTGAFTYSWSSSGGQTTATATGLNGGSYTVTITDANNCTRKGAVTVSVTPCGASIIVVTSSYTVCPGSCTTVSASASGGSSPYTYSWSNSATGQNINVCPTSTTNYTVIVTDALGNTATNVSNVYVVPIMNISSNTLPVSCFGGSDGVLELTNVTGGGGSPYNYIWSPGGHSGSFPPSSSVSGLIAGTYSITVTDALGCSQTGTPVSITEPPVITANTNSTNASCGSSDGSVSVSAGGGTPGYSYSWSSAHTTSSVSNLPGGVYSVTVTDSKGCTIIKPTVVNTTPSASVTATPTAINCYGNNTGIVTATVSGGTGPYSYNWLPAGTTGISTGTLTINNQPAGNYILVVADNGGCVNSQTITITEPSQITPTLTATNASCGNSNGSIVANASGGTPGYSYSWSALGGGTGITGSSLTGLSAGSYTVDITDANNCTLSQSITVNNGAAAVNSTQILTQCDSAFINSNWYYISQTIKDTLANAASNGCDSIITSTLTITNDISTFGFANICTGQSVLIHGTSQNTSGVYTQTFTAVSNGCDSISSITLNIVSAIINNLTPSICTGDSIFTGDSWKKIVGSYSDTLTGASMGGCDSIVNTTLTIKPAFSTPSALSICAGQSVLIHGVSQNTPGVYTQTFFAANGCDSTSSVTLTVGATSTNNMTTSICSGDSVFAAGAWQKTSGIYSSTLVGSSGCDSIVNITLTINTAPTVDAGRDTTIVAGQSITLSASGAGTYSWSTGETTTTINQQPTTTTTYIITITDLNGCTVMDSVIVFVENLCDDNTEIFVPNSFSPNGDGQNDVLQLYSTGTPETIYFAIYNRWGEKVFEANDMNTSWDGSYRNKPADTAVFTWVLKITCKDQTEEIIKKGNISLLR